MSVLTFLGYSFALAALGFGLIFTLDYLRARRAGRRFVGLTAALSDPVALRAFGGLFVALFIGSCFVLLLLTFTHIVSI